MVAPFGRSELANTSAENFIPTSVEGGRNWFHEAYSFKATAAPADSDGRLAISADAGQAEIKRTIEQGVQAFDLLPLLAGNRRALFIGERHDDPGHKDEIIKSLQTLKDRDGLTHVALEMLNDNDMPAVRSYFAGTGSREAVLERLKMRWSVTPEAPEKYMQLIDAVKAAKLTPLGLDRVGRGDVDNRGTLLEDRNQHWADVVGKVLEADSKAKVLVYSGRDHVGYGGAPHANEILKSDYGEGATVVVLASKYDKPDSLPLKVAQAADDLHLGGRRFALAINQSAAERPGDFVLHTPD